MKNVTKRPTHSKINIRQLSSSCIFFLLLFPFHFPNLEGEVGFASLMRGDYGGDCVAAVVLLAVAVVVVNDGCDVRFHTCCADLDCTRQLKLL